jgi:EAL domain-containing protein (putative c-di-GMP-specific phosphodiesterase class I)
MVFASSDCALWENLSTLMTETLEASRLKETSTSADEEIESPPLAPGEAPLCFVVDEESSTRHFLSLILHGSGVDAIEFADGVSMRKAIEQHNPRVVFLDVPLQSADAIESVIALGKRRFTGNVQLMSSRGAAVLEHVKAIGTQHKLKMLPVLKKPFETDAILKIINELKLGTPHAAAMRIDLDDALSKKWVEFWYQPKIDLRKKQLAGAEAYVRVRHPEHGIVLPPAFMPGASETVLQRLSELAIADALTAGSTFAKLGVNLRISVNIPVEVLNKLPVADLLKTHPQAQKWPGLILDVKEEQIIKDLSLAAEVAKKLEPLNVRLAIDRAGRSCSSLAKLKELPFAEIKLDRQFVAECGSDKINAPICKAAIDLAHNFSRLAVAVGVEKAADAGALMSMRCDYGQGYLFGQPMPAERFVSLLRQRAANQGAMIADQS